MIISQLIQAPRVSITSIIPPPSHLSSSDLHLAAQIFIHFHIGQTKPIYFTSNPSSSHNTEIEDKENPSSVRTFQTQPSSPKHLCCTNSQDTLTTTHMIPSKLYKYRTEISGVESESGGRCVSGVWCDGMQVGAVMWSSWWWIKGVLWRGWEWGEWGEGGELRGYIEGEGGKYLWEWGTVSDLT